MSSVSNLDAAQGVHETLIEELAVSMLRAVLGFPDCTSVTAAVVMAGERYELTLTRGTNE